MTQERQFEDFFYQNRVPEINELVMVRVESIDEMGIICSLLEYNNIEGFLPFSELTRTRMRSVHRHVKIGQKQILSVIRVDAERGFTDLSKKWITGTETEEGTEKYHHGKTVHSISRRIAEVTGRDLEEIKEELVYPLYDEFEDPFEAFKMMAAGEEDIYEGLDIDPELKEILEQIVKKRLSIQPVKIGARVNVTCYGEGGVDSIKKALYDGLDVDENVSINLDASPTYNVTLVTLDEKGGVEILDNIIEVIRVSIEQEGGSLAVELEPQVIGKVDSR
eukprot:TRINITY_DN12051_c0_g1_i1.p1 TRINITY_DN12051_c0_g1~~TRINITY_DN12051_c0_g1_i1.p1  ORF type:complete len:286 (+),score=93.48 TRINITY_DN12051_c0_g1_i1:27-860(+)